MFVVKSDTNGTVYLKTKSYGTYTGNKFTQAPEYDKLFMSNLSAYYLASKAGENSGMDISRMEIQSLCGAYVLPYYSLEYGLLPQSSDTSVTGYAGAPYNVDYVASISGAILPDELKAFEQMYSQFVYENYCQIGAQTNAYFQQIIIEQGFNASDPEIIEKVARYIQNAATYDLDYDRSLDACSDIAVEFLKTYKSGVCQHYATAATMLYRALGIPARYTIGYAAYVIAGQDVEVTSATAHAWVEVYINGVGWIQVEVTGSGEGSTNPGDPNTPGIPGNPSDPGDEEDIYDFLGEIVVIPKKQIKVDDSTPLYAKNEIIESGALAELVARGCTYLVEVSGVQKGVGIGESHVVSFKLFDAQGRDITDMCDITYETGMLEIVSKGIIDIYIYEKNFVYDGTEKGYLNTEYFVVNPIPGVELEIDSINIVARDATIMNSDYVTHRIYWDLTFSIYENGVLTSSGQYTVRVVYLDGSDAAYDVITITKRDITITTGSAEKPYDEEPLENDTFYVSLGMLGQGHEVELTVMGSITEKGETFNTINMESLRITDEYGNNVTNNYNVTYILGVLKVT